MTEPAGPDSPSPEDHPNGLARKNRGVRFSDSEWDAVKHAALARNTTPAEFVRERILELVHAPSDPASHGFPAHLVPLVERTFRYSWMLATRMREEMGRDGRGEEVEALVDEARALQDRLRDPGSAAAGRTPADTSDDG